MKTVKWLNHLKLIPIYFLFFPMWVTAGVSKLTGDGVPVQFSEKFASTFISHFPGVTVAYYKIAVLEVIAAVLFLVSFLKGEFLAGRSKALLHWAMFVSVLLFAILCFGLRLSGSHEMAAQLFSYFAGATVVWIFVASVEKV